MRLWGKIYKGGEKLAEDIVEIDVKKKSELRLNEDRLLLCLTELTHSLDLERPVMVKKHMRDFTEFGRAVFLPPDFMDAVEFDRFVVEVIP